MWCLTETGVPTSVDFVQCEPTQMVVAYTSSNAYVFDIEKSKPVITLDYKPSLGIVCLWFLCVVLKFKFNPVLVVYEINICLHCYCSHINLHLHNVNVNDNLI